MSTHRTSWCHKRRVLTVAIGVLAVAASTSGVWAASPGTVVGPLDLAVVPEAPQDEVRPPW